MKNIWKKLVKSTNNDKKKKRKGFSHKCNSIKSVIHNKLNLDKGREEVKKYMEKVNKCVNRMANINKKTIFDSIFNNEPIWIKKIKNEIEEHDDF